jgi:eukaryotic-like serine/threonine-protein kinase
MSESNGGGVAYRYRFGSAEFDEARFELTVGGLPVELERRPLEVLAMLLRHAGEVVTKEELLETVWAGRVTVENVLANAVAKLRKGLGEANADLIVTQARVGYRLDGPVERVATGRRLLNQLNLGAGQPVPGRAHFILQRQLSGTSGSEVWLARHDKTGETRVYKFSPDGERLAQLKREATLSRLLREGLGERDDIARVIDWNFETPPFFLECAYGGQSLAEWAEEDGRLASLSVAERLGLALQAAEAVAAAHEAGVLHKDLKPANLLVASRKGGGWQVRITDFGAGALLDPSVLNEFGVTPLGLTMDGAGSSSASLGTPLYIAPEIIAGEAPTARSDVYSLGVLLYQILAGDIRKPMTTGWERDIADPLLREDLAAATSGDPAERTASASALADRLRSLETRRAARAQREETERAAAAAQRELERMRARRPWMAATVGVLAAGFGVSLWLFGQANDARHVAEAQAARAEATGAFLSDLLVNADPHAPGGSGAVTVREALDRAAGGIAARFAEDPESEAAIRMEAAEIYGGLADYAGAAEHRERAAWLFEEMYGAKDRRTLEARYRYAQALTNASRYDEAAAVFAAAEKDAGAVLGSDPALAFAAAQARARLYLMQADIEPAAAALEEALRLAPIAAPDDARAPFRLRMDLSQCYSRLGRHDEAVAMLEEMQDERYAGLGVSAASRASASLYYGASLLYAARYEEAEPALKKSIEALTGVFGADSPQVIEAYSSLGNLYATSGRWAEAQPVIATVREKMCAMHGAAHLTCMMATGNEGVIAFQSGRAGDAIGKIGPARDAFVEALGAQSPAVHVLGYYLAMAELDAGETEAAALHGGALDPVRLESGSPGEQWEARVKGLEARILIARGQCAEGKPLLDAAIAEMEAGAMQEWIVAPYKKSSGTCERAL